MDSRDLIIIGVLGIGAWWLYKRHQAAAKPVADSNPAGASSMVAGAAAQTQTGPGITRGLYPAGPGPDTMSGRIPNGPGTTPFQAAVDRLLALNSAAPPVATVPVVVSSPSAGVPFPLGSRPPPQQLDPLQFPGLRGVR